MATLAQVFEPRLAAAAQWIARVPGLLPGAQRALVAALGERLLACAAPALVEDPRPALPAYPVARRLCAAAEALWRERCFAFAERIPRPVAELVVHAGFLGSGAPTLIATFGDGTRGVYRDRDLRAGAWLVGAAAAIGLPSRELAAHADHAWDTFVVRAPCATPADAARYYERYGMWLRLCEATRSTDMHALNLVAAGDAPQIVDVEGALAVHDGPMTPERTGMLPVLLHGDADLPAVNVGGLHRGGTVVLPYLIEVLRGARLELERDREEVAPTLPELDGALVPPDVDALLAGYARADACLHLVAPPPPRLTSPVFRRAGIDYRRLLRASLAPALLADETRRDAFLASCADPDEIPALRDLRIPLLRAPAAAPALWPLAPDERAANERAIRASLAML